MSMIDTLREQMLPKLEPREIDRLRRFGRFGAMPRARRCS